MKSNLVFRCHVHINNLPYSDRYFTTDRQIGTLKEAKLMDMILVKCILQNCSNICGWYTLELPHRGNSNVHLQHMFIQSIGVFHHNRFFHNLLNYFFMFQCKEHVEMNKYLCSLACAWMTIIDGQFYIIDSLSLDVSFE